MLTFPTFLFKPTSVRAQLVAGGESGGQATSGVEPIGPFPDGGAWRISFGQFALWDRDDLMAKRALDAALDNGAAPVIVPLGDRLHAPVIAPPAALASPDDVIWDDAASWTPVEVTAAVTADAAAGDTALSFDFAGPLAPEAGAFFSIAGATGWRLYQIERLTDNGGGNYAAALRPALREAAPIATLLNFEGPRCTCRLEGDPATVLEWLRFGQGGPITFVETFPNVTAATVYAHDTRKYLLLDTPGRGIWHVPLDWQNAGATFEAISGGAAGSGVAGLFGGVSGAGGAYALEDRDGTRFEFVPGQWVAFEVGRGGKAAALFSPLSAMDSRPSWLGHPDAARAECVVYAAATSSVTAGAQIGASRGRVRHRGGNGAATQFNPGPGSGGGGAGGPNGDGGDVPSSIGGGAGTGIGGAGDAGFGGAGGDPAGTLNGAAGSELGGGLAGSGGGGAAVLAAGVGPLGGNGGLYGGGGGVGDFTANGGKGGRGGKGCILISWLGDASL